MISSNLICLLVILNWVSSQHTEPPKQKPYYPRIKFPSNISSRNNDVSESRIFKGNFAKNTQFPFQALLNIDHGTFYCGGSLIHPSWVLTAAHCVHGAQSVVVRFGSVKMHDGGHIIAAQEIIPHTQYDTETNINDIALLKLTNPVPKNKGIKPLKLQQTTNSCNNPLKLLVLGWGLTTKTSDISPSLKFVNVNEITNLECFKTYGFENVPPTVMCSRGKKLESSCQGDSGGPLIIPGNNGNPPVQIGVVAFGGPHCGDGLPSGYTRVALYLDWIRYITQLNL